MAEYKVVTENGDTFFYKPGTNIRHREGGPAIIWDDGSEEWWLNDKLHREDGPAIIADTGTKYWYLNGKRHREDGPAVIKFDGTKKWWLNGEEVTEEDVMGKPEYSPETITLNGKTYRLVEE